MDTNYLEEAFKRLSLLEDDFDISVDADKVDELRSFIEDDVDEIPEEEIVDVNAEDESELEDNYIGKVILECECCHSRIYKDMEEVVIDDESGLANIDEACPVCNNELGYTVIGKIEPFDSEKEIKPEEDEELPADDVEEVEDLPADDVDEEEVEESLENRISRKHLTESSDDVCPHCGKNPCECKESCEKEIKENLGGAPAEKPNNLGLDPDRAVDDDVKLETPQENPIDENPSILNIKEDLGRINPDDAEYLDGEVEDAQINLGTLSREAREAGANDIAKIADDANDQFENNANKINEDINNISVDTDDSHLDITSDDSGRVTVTTEPLIKEEIDVNPSITDEPDDMENGPEEIVPLNPEEEVEIENNDEENPGEEVFDEIPEDESEEEEFDIEDFDEETFDDMGESYMRKVYSNINNYKTTKINESNNSIIIEGLITFRSGTQKKTKFVFENAVISKRGKLVLEGYNTTFTPDKNSFMLRGIVSDKKYLPERFIYNYKVKQLNESTNSDEIFRVFGRIKKR